MPASSARVHDGGRPLRALALLVLGLGIWLMLRLPILQRDLARASTAPTRDAGSTSRLTLVSAAPANRTPANQAPPATLAVAEARLAVVEARLAVAEAQLALVELRAGVAPSAIAPPRMPMATAQIAAAPAPARSRPALLASDWVIPITAPPRRIAARSPAPVSPSPPAPAVAAPTAHTIASQAYVRLAAGDRRGAAGLFDAALAAAETPADPRRADWLAERRRLGRRWSGDGYALFRDAGFVGPAASPVLGGGQSGGSLAYTHDPLARRPVALVARFNAATGSGGQVDSRSGQAALGVRWRVLPELAVTAERLIAIGEDARDEWALRLAAGASGNRLVSGRRIEWSGYAEAGVLGAGDAFGGAQARAAVPVLRLGRAALLAGPGAWGSVQTGGGTVGRFDVGLSLIARAPLGRTNLELAADWRFRLAGNAAPGSGPALTLSTGF